MKRYLLIFGILVTFKLSVQAQITIEFPYSRLIFQQDTLGMGSILVSGYTESKVDTVQVRLIPFDISTGTATEWINCLTSVTDNQQNFSAVVKAAAGWYNLEARAINDTTTVAEASLSRVGIGEVFIIAGQSNAQGQNFKEARSSKDPYERVGAFSGYDENMVFPSFKAEQLNHYISVYPVGVTSWCWAELGDKIAERLNAPVFFLNTGWGGTASQDWVDSVDSTAVFEEGRGYIPYNHLHRTIQFYRNVLGVRAVLWHQGEEDSYRNNARSASSPAINYFNNLQKIINPSRKQAGGDLAWVISQVSYIYGQTDSSVLNAQRKLASELPNVFSGPYTDTIANARIDGAHFTNEFNTGGLTKLASAWNQALDSTFFKQSVPMMPNYGKNLFVIDSNNVIIPPGFTVRQVPGKQTKSFRFLTDEMGNFYTSPILTCGKRFMKAKTLPRRGSFNDARGAAANKLVILTNTPENYANYRRNIPSKPVDLSESTTTFTIEVGGCFSD